MSHRTRLTSHANVKIVWPTHSASLGGTLCTPGSTPRQQWGLPWSTRRAVRVQKLLLTIIAGVIIMLNSNITRSTSAISAGVLAERCSSENANRRRCFPKALHSSISITCSTRRRRTRGAKDRERNRCLWS